MIKEAGIVFDELEEEAFDMPFGLASGAGVIFRINWWSCRSSSDKPFRGQT